jgi:hypothetical protein
VVAATLTNPALPGNLSTSIWWDRLAHGAFVPLDGTGALVWFGVLTALALGLTIGLTPRLRIERRQWPIAALGLGGWLLVDRSGGTLIRGHDLGGELALIAIVATAAVLTWQAAVRIRWQSPRRASPG